jgi:ribosomal protein S12 methylthiotransferase
MLLDFVEAAQLDWVGVFAYSPEEGSSSAEISRWRRINSRRRTMATRCGTWPGISAARRLRWIGRTIEVLIEKASPDGRRGVGRMQGQAPEIDGLVRLTRRARAAPLIPGQFISAHVSGSTAYDLQADVTDRSSVFGLRCSDRSDRSG